MPFDPDMIIMVIQLTLPVVLIGLGYLIGSGVERGHYRSIRQRESATVEQPAVTLRQLALGDAQVGSATLVTGSVVVSIDYFKRVLAALRALAGGRVSAYETLVDRARREALLRMKANASGADLIVGVRIETSTIGARANSRGSVGSIEALAYGTAIVLAES